MTSPTEITVNQLSRLIGLPDAPAIIDVRIDDDYALDRRMVPGAARFSHRDIDRWAGRYTGRKTVIICQQGKKLSQGAAALLRHGGIASQTLAGGFEAWTGAQALTFSPDKLPERTQQGATLWVTRARPKIDRIACPWLIRRFIDPGAVFLFVAPGEVEGVADRFDATPFDIDGGFWSHRNDTCSFDTMLAEFGLQSEPLSHMAAIVRGADTARPDLAAESAGLLAMSLGLSRMYRDDLQQLEASMGLYDALYRWCRDATGEAHDWPPQRNAA